MPTYPIRPLLAALGLAACALPLAAAAADDAIATDRPDFVESSDVVGRQRIQIETSVGLDRNRADGVRQSRWATPTLVRFGVTDTVELRVETDGALRERTRVPSQPASTERGAADLSLGLKWHALDGADSVPSVGVLLHADLSTGSPAFRDEGTRPTARVVAEWDLPNALSLGMMPGIGYEKANGGGAYGIFGIVLGKAWSERLRSFVELSAPHIARASHGGVEASASMGVAYLVQNNLQIDTAVSRGLNARTPDLSFTVGLSIKL